MALEWKNLLEGLVASGPVAVILGVWIYKLHQALESKDALLKEWGNRFIDETKKSSATYKDLAVALELLREVVRGKQG